jgi:hypothetical protein
MATPLPGVGFLIANDILTDCSYVLFEPVVNTSTPAAIAVGSQTVPVWDPSMYVGASVIVGNLPTNTVEVVTITATNPGTSFTATFANTHTAGEPIVGATFPVRQTTDPLFTQAEMIAYLSTATNDFMTDVPLVYNVASVTVIPTEQVAALPPDCLNPIRVAPYSVVNYLNVYQYPLRETSQSNLDAMIYNWTQAAAAQPYAYFRDKTGLQNFGIFPKPSNTSLVEVVYAQRGSQVKSLYDGFLVPDPFLIYIKYRVLSFAFSKDGEMRNSGLAKYFSDRYDLGVKISTVFLAAIQDPNLQMAQ